MAKNYLHEDQDDLRVRTIWSEDLAGYTADVFVYFEDDGIAAEQLVGAATVVPGDDESSIFYDIAYGESPFDSGVGYYVFTFEITLADRHRRSRPRRWFVDARGGGVR